MSQHQLTYVAFIVGYLILIMGLALYIARNWIGDETDFMVAGREVGAWLNATSLIAILWSGGFVPTLVLMGFMFGVGGVWFFWGWAVGQLLVLVTWVGFWRYSGGYTPAEYFEYQYGTSGRLASLVAILFFAVPAAAFQYLGAGSLISGAIGTDQSLTIAVVGAIIVLYALLAGMWGISMTDFLQAIWVGISVFIAVPIYLFVTEGLPTAGVGAIEPAMLSFPFGTMPILKLAGGTVITFIWLNYILAHGAHYWIRASTGRSDRKVKQAWVIAIVISIVSGLIGAYLGLWGRMLVPDAAPPKAFGQLLAQETPVWLGAFAISGIIAATMSTADMMYQMSANTLTRDFFQRFMAVDTHEELLRYSRYTILGMGVLTIGVAIGFPGTLPNMIAFALSFASPLWVMSLDSWVTRYGTKEAAVLTVAVVIPVVFYWNFVSGMVSQIQTLWAAGAAALIVFYGVSFITHITGPWWSESVPNVGDRGAPQAAPGGDD